MKKFLKILSLAATVALGSATVAFGASPITIDSERVGSNTGIVPILGEYAETGDIGAYSIKVAWDETARSVYRKGARTWNPVDHTWAQGGSSWEGTSQSVTITNHSAYDVNVGTVFAGRTVQEDSNTIETDITGKVTAIINEVETDVTSVDLEKVTEGSMLGNSKTVNVKVTGGALKADGELGNLSLTLNAVSPE